MRLYHGSNCKIRTVDLNFSRLYMDFGRGFYLTPDYQKALMMAIRTRDLRKVGSLEVNSFIFNRSSCPPEIRIKEFDVCDYEWARFIMLNRDKTLSPRYQHPYDIVIGPVADSRIEKIIDKYRKEFGNRYLEPDNLTILAKKLKYPGKTYIQYCFCTEKALQYLFSDY